MAVLTVYVLLPRPRNSWILRCPHRILPRCSVFTAVAYVEAAIAIRYGQTVNLSEQQALNCAPGSFGFGGFLGEVFNWIFLNGGIANETDIPYMNAKQSCAPAPSPIAQMGSAYTRSFTIVTSSFQMINAVKVAPLPIMINSDDPRFRNYTGGILTCSAVSNDYLASGVTHYVLVVGYNYTSSPPYFVIKNSWGTGWGESGYARIAMAASGSG